MVPQLKSLRCEGTSHLYGWHLSYFMPSDMVKSKLSSAAKFLWADTPGQLAFDTLHSKDPNRTISRWVCHAPHTLRDRRAHALSTQITPEREPLTSPSRAPAHHQHTTSTPVHAHVHAHAH